MKRAALYMRVSGKCARGRFCRHRWWSTLSVCREFVEIVPLRILINVSKRAGSEISRIRTLHLPLQLSALRPFRPVILTIEASIPDERLHFINIRVWNQCAPGMHVSGDQERYLLFEIPSVKQDDFLRG